MTDLCWPPLLGRPAWAAWAWRENISQVEAGGTEAERTDAKKLRRETPSQKRLACPKIVNMAAQSFRWAGSLAGSGKAPAGGETTPAARSRVI